MILNHLSKQRKYKLMLIMKNEEVAYSLVVL